jgi:heat shock protein HtpX
MQAFGLYTHIRANRTRSVILIGGMFLLVYVVTFALSLIFEAFRGNDQLARIMARAFADLQWAWPWASVGALLWIWLAYEFNQSIIAAVTGSHGIAREAEPRLYNLLENLCISRGLATPRLEIMEVDELNAFASGLNEKQYAVTVTRGLLNTLNDAELEAVLGHELTHIRNGDVRLMVIAGVMAGIISFFGERIFRWLTDGRIRWRSSSSSDSSYSSSSSSDDKKGGGAFLAILIGLALLAICWFLSQYIKFALSRRREFLADAGAVELTKNPDAMISALQKIDGRGELPGAPSGLMEMCVDNPRSGIADLFATHPSIASRIDALVKFAGGHVSELPKPTVRAIERGEGAPPAGSDQPGPWDHRGDNRTPTEPAPAPAADQPGPWSAGRR